MGTISAPPSAPMTHAAAQFSAAIINWQES